MMSVMRVVMLAVLAPVALGACSLFKNKSDWDQAVENRPLEVPPDLDRPVASGNLVVPEGGTGSGAAAAMPPGGRTTTGIDGLHVEDTPDGTWQRIGTALERANLGAIDVRDEAARTYAVTFTLTRSSDEGKGWFKRMVTRERKTTTTQQVNIGVSADGSGSRVSVSGDRAAVQKVMNVLRERLG